MGGSLSLPVVPAVIALLLALVQAAWVCSAESGEFYVYEIAEEFGALRNRLAIRLTRVNQSAFRVDLLRVEPETMKDILEGNLALFNWTVAATPVSDGGHRALFLSSGISAPFPLYLDPGLVELACRRAGEVERAIKTLLDPSARPEERERVLSQLRFPNRPSLEWEVISWVVGDPRLMAGLWGYPPATPGASYSLTARCGGGTRTFSCSLRYSGSSGRTTSIEATSSYSGAGWLLGAKITFRDGERTWASEVRLIETSNQEVLSRAPDVLRVAEGLASNPQALALVIAVVAVAVAVAVLKSRT